MILRVYIRDRYTKRGQEETHSLLDKNAMDIQYELYANEIHYQNIAVKDDGTIPYIQILCADDEERDHIKDILLRNRHILCFEIGTKRYFAKYAQEDEKS
jgi:hypothetical protein